MELKNVSRETFYKYMADYVTLQVSTPYNFFYNKKTAFLNGGVPIIYRGETYNDYKSYPVSLITEGTVSSLFKANLAGYNQDEIICSVTTSDTPLTTIEWYKFSENYLKVRVIIEGIEKTDQAVMYFNNEAEWADIEECYFIPCGKVEWYNGTRTTYFPIVYFKDTDGYYKFSPQSPTDPGEDVTNWLLQNSNIDEDPYGTTPDSKPDGGFGDFDYSGDPVAIPDLPTISVADSGFVTLFNPTIGQLQSLASYMWTGLFDIDNFRKIFADPMDCIISLSIVPVSPPLASAEELKVGNIGTGISISRLDKQFVKVSYAAKNIGLRTNGFMDFSPYTKCEIFLPYIGVHSLSIDDIAGADITIEYHIDLFSGACTAYIKCSKNNSDGSPINSVLYQFTGNVVCNIPISATNFSSFLQSMIGAVAAGAVGVATGGAGATAAGAVSAINATMSMKPEIERSGNLASASGFLGIQTPFLILTYPNLCRPSGRPKTVGTPSFSGLSNNKKLNSFHGFTQLHKVNVTGFPCTELEKNMVASELMEGVILP